LTALCALHVSSPRQRCKENQIIIKIILKAFVLMTFILAAGFLSVSHAQQSTTAVTGDWVGNSEPAGWVEFYISVLLKMPESW